MIESTFLLFTLLGVAVSPSLMSISLKNFPVYMQNDHHIKALATRRFYLSYSNKSIGFNKNTNAANFYRM